MEMPKEAGGASSAPPPPCDMQIPPPRAADRAKDLQRRHVHGAIPSPCGGQGEGFVPSNGGSARMRPPRPQITVPWGIRPFLGMMTIPSRK